ncbi:hypothetical protein ABH922_003163 [Rhodococcus sp. 27YEA15]|uniref:hypothetical protein n=1 Tax=Rhodococcus sp. 27YEA15 TaxID=3156259 RepID=UPI003C7E5A8D
MSDNDEHTGTREDRKPQGPSALLLLVGFIALAVSLWALIGPFFLDPGTDIQFRWLFVGAAVLAGLLLVILPNRRKK